MRLRSNEWSSKGRYTKLNERVDFDVLCRRWYRYVGGINPSGEVAAGRPERTL